MPSPNELKSAGQRAAGRPANPYDTANPLWKIDGTAGLLFPAKATRSHRQSTTLTHRPTEAVRALLRLVKVPCSRRAIASILHFTHGYDPLAVTRALKQLTATRAITRTSLPAVRKPFTLDAENAEDQSELVSPHVYSMGAPLPSHLRYLAKLHERARDLFNTTLPGTNRSIVGHAAEVLVARRLRALGWANVPDDKYLGSIRIPGCETNIDVTGTNLNGKKFTLEVRNTNEVQHAGSRSIIDAAKCRTESYDPILVVPYALESARSECERRGVRLVVLGAQIVDATTTIRGTRRRTEPIIAELRGLIGPQPIHFLKSRNDADDTKFDAQFQALQEALVCRARCTP